MFYTPTEEFIQKLADTARSTTDRLLADAHRYGINPDDPWSEQSLESVATAFLRDDDFSQEDLGLFLGEGLVRTKNYYWSLSEGRGDEDTVLWVFFEAIVVRPDHQAGTTPIGWINQLQDTENPYALMGFMDG